MERKSQSAYSGIDKESGQNNEWLTPELAKQLPKINFFRFCQWIEHRTNTRLGENQTPKADVLRFRPHPGMGFPASELKSITVDEYFPEQAPSVMTTFLGLYGVDSPLPTNYVDDIAQGREGTDAVKGFLDIFNHRITTHYYRIWKKYNYPATFEHGGEDATSQCLLGLIGLGIDGSASRLGTPLSRYLALLGPMRLPTRTAEGLHALVKLLAPNTATRITPHYPVRIVLDEPVQLKRGASVNLASRAVLGKTGVDCNSELKLELITEDPREAIGWLPDGQIYQDLLLLMRGYLGYRCTVRLVLTVPKRILPAAQIGQHRAQLGRTGILGWKGQLDELPSNDDLVTSNVETDLKLITVTLGRYAGLPS
ncbi:type VI secretion system baseplate subunit TssG [Thorsellia anophelis]|uniref:Type VI secretion system protein ImpH n=1 Tax=Thorsellia anophelis DSM 18579 TaxID=1123402 RepID=A0A1I0FTD1_9GAMM|nr:type VI secretion system baseplate subunit TssG [Thorsellia anophelis]SET61595.1 type VI secretion system protein ImpH [Thorsellia anophelis DSM 18579]